MSLGLCLACGLAGERAPFRAGEDGEVGIVGSLNHTLKNLEQERG